MQNTVKKVQMYNYKTAEIWIQWLSQSEVDAQALNP